MAIGLAPAPVARGRRLLLAGAGIVVVAVALVATALLEWTGAQLTPDKTALARVEIEPLGGTLERVSGVDPEGRPIALANAGGRLTPARKIAPGTRVTITVVTRRPGWNGWLIGKTRERRLTVTAPIAHVTDQWITRPAGAEVPVTFSEPVARVGYAGRTARGTGRSLAIPAHAKAGTVRVAVAARPWERLGPMTTIHYFPPAKRPVALVSPAPGGKLDPGGQIRLTLSQKTGETPKLSPALPGHWKRGGDGHTLTFTPSGSGPALGSRVKLTLADPVAAGDTAGRDLQTTREIAWTVPPASPLRMIQLLADEGYLPVEFKGPEVAHTVRAQAGAAADPPEGSFEWRYANTPKELTRQWKPEPGNVVVKGAVMMFQDERHLTVDGLPGPDLWKALLHDAVADRAPHKGYSYVYVHRDDRPQQLALWHNGSVILTSPGNTGVPAAPTELGTFPVFEHLAETTMSGTNPDGSHYNDPGIKYVSYFNGGDALHAFDRASFGTPQSVGCVELPLASAKRIWPYTPIGTLVTIEH